MNEATRGRAAFFTPYFHEARGNATTAKRLITGLEALGYHIEWFAYEEEEWTFEDEQRINQCDIVHILHFGRFSLWQQKTNYELTTPYLLTMGGTDVNIDIYDESRRSRLTDVLTKASAITVFSNDAKVQLQTVFPFCVDKITVIPSSFWLPESSSTDSEPILHGTSPQVLLPAGLRKVKDVLYLIPALAKLKEGPFPGLTFSIVGTIIEQEIHEKVQAVCKKYEWVHFHEELPLESMPGVYRQADVVVNSSLSEGQSGAIVEALYLKIPVLARKIPGNESLITDEVNGLLFASLAEFTEKFEKLLNDSTFRDKLVRNGKQLLKQVNSFEKEMQAYGTIYENIHVNEGSKWIKRK